MTTESDVNNIVNDELTETAEVSGSDPLGHVNFSNVCGVLIQYPDTNGEVRDLTGIVKKAKDAGTILITAADLLACTLIKAPGDYGAPSDIVIGTAQRLGIPLNYGGPHAAFLACRSYLTRLIPGRVVGVAKDTDGNPALRLALQTREQHIRRDKATSNICTAQALLANMSAMYAIYHGPEGLRNMARCINEKTAFLAKSISLKGEHEVLNKWFFDTLKVRVKSQKRIRGRAESLSINLRYFPDGKHVGVSLDETVTDRDVNDLIWIFGAADSDTPVSCTSLPSFYIIIMHQTQKSDSLKVKSGERHKKISTRKE